MHAGHTTIYCKVEHLDVLLAQWKQMTSEARRVKGLRHAYFLADHKTGKCLAIGIWESIELAEAFSQSEPFKFFLETIKPLIVEVCDREVFHVDAYWD